MKAKNINFKDIIEGKRLTFLVGAGCSVDAPSCIPAGREMMNKIIKYTCQQSEIDKLLEIEQLRFEQLVEIIRDRLDPGLKIIDYYGLCDKPNIQHFFLAEMLKKGHFVMTTNFDFLIEYALIQSGVPEGDIVPVITKKDFMTYNCPQVLFNDNKKAVYKIHGSTKNIITNKGTRDSLVATIQAFGLGKEGESIFQIEPFKRPMFENISRNRTLVMIGYSGNDDFDIIPTLKLLKDVENIIWIDYITNDGGIEQIYEIDDKTSKNTEKANKATRILEGIYSMKNAKNIYYIKCNTSRLLKDLLKINPLLNPNEFSLDPIEWLASNVKSANKFQKYIIPYKIYNSFDMHSDSMRCLKSLLSLAEEYGELSWKSTALNDIGEIYKAQGKYTESLKLLKEAFKIDEQLNSRSGKATRLNNIGRIYEVQGDYIKAIKYYKESLKIDEEIKNLSGKATDLNNIGFIYKKQGNYAKALDYYNEALKISENIGNLSKKAIFLNNI
ncbi:MAG: tetratricopeptide repeat protein, partial [Candidatus Lokiarchaeota archaeon]|nr:tetratricopeptide repeat protein [Candidatus Lokiarchaeota archaeon]